MSRNRLSLSDQVLGSSPGAAVPAFSNAFMAFPLPWPPPGGLPALWQQVYQMALEQARAVVRPSRWERCYVASPN
jgi:hypothetical protein